MSSDGLELSAAKLGHFVENVGVKLGFCLLVGKAARFQFGADDDCLPTAHYGLSSTALIVSAAPLPGHATTSGYDGDALVAKRWITIRVGAQNRSLRRRDDDLDADTKAVREQGTGGGTTLSSEMIR